MPRKSDEPSRCGIGEKGNVSRAAVSGSIEPIYRTKEITQHWEEGAPSRCEEESSRVALRKTCPVSVRSLGLKRGLFLD